MKFGQFVILVFVSLILSAVGVAWLHWDDRKRKPVALTVAKLKELKEDKEYLVKKHPDMVIEIEQIIEVKRIRIMEEDV